MLKWCLNRADQSKNVRKLREMTGTYSNTETYKLLRPSQIIESEKLVTKAIDVIQEEYINPFSILVDEDKLFNLSSGVPVQNDLAEEILQIHSVGNELAKQFAAERMLSDSTKKFHDPLPRNKCKSFKNSTKVLVISKNKKETTVTVNRDILASMVKLSLKSGFPVDFDRALQYPMSPIPLSIATAEGERRSTAKSKLMEIITSYCTNPPKPPKMVIKIPKEKPSALIIDLIAAIRTITDIPSTYFDLTWKLLASLPKGYQRVDIVADTYKPTSIKIGERLKRGTSARLMISSPNSKVPRDFQNFLKNGENKTRLIALIGEVIAENSGRAMKLLKCERIIYSMDSCCFLIDENGTQEIDSLKSNQEEADTKVILHCLDALNTPESTVVLRSPSADTDIMVLAITIIRQFCERLFFDYGSGKNRKAVRLSDINMQNKEKDALLGFHAFTGNDYISSFFRKGKPLAWKCMKKKEKFLEAFAAFGTSWTLNEDYFNILEEYVCNLYGNKIVSVDKVRMKLFNKKVSKNKRAPDISLLPPCKQVLRLHASRAMYVANMWRLTSVAWIDLPNITDYGWETDGSPVWIITAFPDDVTELLVTNIKSTDSEENEDDYDDEDEDEEDEDETFENDNDSDNDVDEDGYENNDDYDDEDEDNDNV